MFFDSHLHLHFPEYENDLDAVIERATRAGVETFVTVGTDAETSRRAVRLAERYPSVFAAVGVHPHDAKEADAGSVEAVARLLEHPRVVAAGEVGLDYYRDHSPRDVQQEVFRTFIRLHLKARKPIMIHCRDAYEDLLKILAEEAPPPYDGVMHCFSSGKEMMERFTALGFYISFAGQVTYKKSADLREAFRCCPEDRLLMETDAPYLAPQAFRGRRNEPAFLVETAKAVAGLRGISGEELGRQAAANARRLFRL